MLGAPFDPSTVGQIARLISSEDVGDAILAKARQMRLGNALG